MNIQYLADRREFIPTVAGWYHAEWGHLRPGSTIEDRVGRVVQSCGYRQIPTAFVAVERDQAQGSAMLLENDMATRPELSPWLAGVFVPPELRGRGIGAALVERVVNEARALGVPRVFLYTPGPGTLYRRLGWRIVERTLYRPFWGDQEVTIMDRATSAFRSGEAAARE